MSRSKLLLVLFGASAISACTAIGQESSEEPGIAVETATLWEVDTSGKPPFRRQRIEVPVVDVASLETEETALETETVQLTDFRGSPPFKRGAAEVEIQEAASFEILQSSEEGNTRRPKRFFKRHR